MKLTFKATKSLQGYHGGGRHFTDGQTQEVPDEEAKLLVQSFPDNFSAQKPKVKAAKPTADKGYRATRNK